MSSVWTVVCPKCGNQETIHTPMALGNGEIMMAREKAKSPCPKCRHAPRKLARDGDLPVEGE